jgi:hypothetical protein
MGFVLSFDAKNAVFRIAFEGRLTDADLFAGYAAVSAYVALHPPSASIVDYSGVTSNELSIKAVRDLVRSPRAMPKGFLRINVAPRDGIYGLARMFQILSEEGRPELRVVRTMDEARSLLGVESLEFLPVGQTNAAPKDSSQ